MRSTLLQKEAPSETAAKILEMISDISVLAGEWGIPRDTILDHVASHFIEADLWDGCLDASEEALSNALEDEMSEEDREELRNGLDEFVAGQIEEQADSVVEAYQQVMKEAYGKVMEKAQTKAEEMAKKKAVNKAFSEREEEDGQ